MCLPAWVRSQDCDWRDTCLCSWYNLVTWVAWVTLSWYWWSWSWCWRYTYWARKFWEVSIPSWHTLVKLIPPRGGLQFVTSQGQLPVFYYRWNCLLSLLGQSLDRGSPSVFLGGKCAMYTSAAYVETPSGSSPELLPASSSLQEYSLVCRELSPTLCSYYFLCS